MPTTFYPRSLGSDVAGNSFVASQKLGQTLTSATTTTTAGGTSITVTVGASAAFWYSGQVQEAVTISGSIIVNIYGFESANAVNAAAGILIERCNSSGTVLSTIVAETTVGAEYGTAIALRTATLTPTSTAMAIGERIKITIKVKNSGTMGAGTVTNRYEGTANATNIRFTEDIRTDEVLDVPHYEIIGGNGYKG